MKVEDIRKLCEEITPGPWINDSGNGQIESKNSTYHRAVVCDRASHFQWNPYTELNSDPRYEMCPRVKPIDPEADMEFIAESRNLIPLLLNIVEAAQNLSEEPDDEVIRDRLNTVLEELEKYNE